MEVTPQDRHFYYTWHFGLFNKQGSWQRETIKDSAVEARVTDALRNFHERFQALLHSLDLELLPAEGFVEQPVKLRA